MNLHRCCLALAMLSLVRLAGGQQPEIVAETPKNTTPIDKTPIVETPITAGDRSHWAFAPIVRQALPATKQTEWLRTAVDAFVLAKLEAKGLSPAREANRATLLRRLSFDLTGLPPTPQQLADFGADQSPDAYERLVDRLLASPAFGERYGQYWLDLARFAETDGYEHDKVRGQAWKYRDWVIAAINADLPYDEFVRQQLAGEGSEVRVQGSGSEKTTREGEPPASNPKSKIPNPKSVTNPAAMFCLSGPDMPDINDQTERRHSLMNELTSAVGSVFLGLQVGCAQCHDHKYDPISQADFYRLRAVFEPAVAPLKRDVAVTSLAMQKVAEPARFWVRGDHRRPGLEVPPGFPRIASTLTRRASEGTPTRSVSEGTLARSASEGPGDDPRAPSLALRASVRSELSDWLMRDDNPLTSRVMANRVWQGHFGRGICETPSDFGVMCGALTHPELLDWLAVELRESGWALKSLHRKIVGSAAYRQASQQGFRVQGSVVDPAAPEPRTLNPDPSASDPENALYHHFPRRRLEGEVIRDAMLAAAGLLTSERGGPGVMPPLPDELVGTLLKGQWTASKREADHYKRSVYVFARRNLRYPIFEAFDRPDANGSCPLRNKSTTAPQSLQLFNSEFSLLAAQHLAGEILSTEEPKDQSAAGQIERLYQIAFARQPTAAEVATLTQFLTQQQQRLQRESRPASDLALPIPAADKMDGYVAAALVDACLAVLNTSEFIYVD